MFSRSTVVGPPLSFLLSHKLHIVCSRIGWHCSSENLGLLCFLFLLWSEYFLLSRFPVALQLWILYSAVFCFFFFFLTLVPNICFSLLLCVVAFGATVVCGNQRRKENQNFLIPVLLPLPFHQSKDCRRICRKWGIVLKWIFLLGCFILPLFDFDGFFCSVSFKISLDTRSRPSQLLLL